MMDLEKAKQRCFDRCNLIGSDVQVDKIMMQYKAIRELPAKEYDDIYDEIVEALGFRR